MIPVACPDLKGREAEYVLDALQVEGRISSSGKYIDQFEKLASERFQRTFALSTSNGTTALHLALLGLSIGHGDEVIVPTFTFAASVATILQSGATPIFIDASPDDWTMDISQLDAVISPRTKAVIAVDLYGMPCDYDVLVNWCAAHHIKLIEDAAEAHGATFNGKPVGSFGDVSCFSFFGNKIITTGEGGMCLTNDPEVFERMRILKNHGMSRPGTYEHAVVGYNYRMTNIQAAIGVAQLERFDDFLAIRAKNESIYRESLAGISGITFQTHVSAKQPVNWLISVLTTKEARTIIPKLRELGVDSRQFFKPMHEQTPYKAFAVGRHFPVADRLHQFGLNLPSSTLLTEEDIHTVCRVLQEVISQS